MPKVSRAKARTKWQFHELAPHGNFRLCEIRVISVIRGSNKGLFEVEDVDESSEFEYCLDVVVHVAHHHAAACCHSALEDAEQYAKAAGGDVFQAPILADS